MVLSRIVASERQAASHIWRDQDLYSFGGGRLSPVLRAVAIMYSWGGGGSRKKISE